MQKREENEKAFQEKKLSEKAKFREK